MITTHRVLQYTTLLLLACGLLHFIATGLVVSDPVDDLSWYFLHPLFLPFREGVETDASGVWNTAQLWMQLSAMLAIVAWARRFRWTLVFIFYMLLGLYTFGTQVTIGVRWLLILASFVLIMARRPRAGVFIQMLLVSLPALFPAFGITVYGFVVGGLEWCVVPAVAVGVLLSIYVVRWIPDGFMLLPAVAVFVLQGLGIVYGPQIDRHHNATVPAEVCEDLDVDVLNDLREWEENQAWTVHEGIDGLYVGGKDRLWKLKDSGELLSTMSTDKGRIFSIRMDQDHAFAVARDAIIRWGPNEELQVVFERLMFPELQHLEIIDGRLFTTPHKFPVLVRADRLETRYFGNPSGIWMFGMAKSDECLFVWDGISVARLDPDDMEVEIARDYEYLDRTIAVYGGLRYLYRGRLLSRSIDVIDPQSLEVVRTLSIDPPPRFFNVSKDESMLAATDFMHETTTVYSLEDGVVLGRFRVGPRPRGLAWSSRKDAFVGVSACGVYVIRPAPAVRREPTGANHRKHAPPLRQVKKYLK